MSKMIRINLETYEKIVNIQAILGATKQNIVKKAIDRLNKDLLLAETDAAFKKLKRNKKAWKQELGERQSWESLSGELDHD